MINSSYAIEHEVLIAPILSTDPPLPKGLIKLSNRLDMCTQLHKEAEDRLSKDKNDRILKGWLTRIEDFFNPTAFELELSEANRHLKIIQLECTSMVPAWQCHLAGYAIAQSDYHKPWHALKIRFYTLCRRKNRVYTLYNQAYATWTSLTNAGSLCAASFSSDEDRGNATLEGKPARLLKERQTANAALAIASDQALKLYRMMPSTNDKDALGFPSEDDSLDLVRDLNIEPIIDLISLINGDFQEASHQCQNEAKKLNHLINTLWEKLKLAQQELEEQNLKLDEVERPFVDAAMLIIPENLKAFATVTRLTQQ